MLYNKICIPAGQGNASIYTKTTFFFHSDIIGVVLAPSVTVRLILFPAPHQTNEIPAYDKKILGNSNCLSLCLALLNAN